MTEIEKEFMDMRDGELFPERLPQAMVEDIIRVYTGVPSLPIWERQGFARLSYKPDFTVHIAGYRASEDAPAQMYFAVEQADGTVTTQGYSQNDGLVQHWNVPKEHIELSHESFMHWVRQEDTHLVGDRQIELERVLAIKLESSLMLHHPLASIRGDYIFSDTMFFQYPKGEKLSSVVVNTTVDIPSLGGECTLRVSRGYWRNGSVSESYKVYGPGAVEIENPFELLSAEQQMQVALTMYERSKYTPEGLIAQPYLVSDTASDIGGRDTNEDSFLHVGSVSGRLGFFVVADGLGGHEDGEIASQAAIEAATKHIARYLYHHVQDPDSRMLVRADIHELIDAAFESAAQAVYDQTIGGKTTLTMALVLDGEAHVGHVGDPRLYQVNAHEQTQITKDHNLAQKLRDEGKDPNEVLVVSGYNPASILLQAVDMPRVVSDDDESDVDDHHFKVEHHDVQIKEDSMICLLTDGGYDNLPGGKDAWLQEEYPTIVSQNNAAGFILSKINEYSSHMRRRDNATVLIVRS